MTLTRASGKPFTLKISWTRLRGKVVLEVIQPLGDESLWSKFLETKGEGIRHIAVNVPNWDYIDNEPSNIIIEPMEEDLYDRVFSNAR